MRVRTDQRLTKAYRKAKVESFDATSKYIFFSDCHRSDGSLSDEFTKNQNSYLYALDYYFDNGFTYVEVGDGDELWEHPMFKHIKSAHYEVFEKIKKFHEQNRLIMLYGNHNIELKNPEYVKKNYYTYYDNYQEATYNFMVGLEPIEALLLKNKNTGQEILTVHGHQGDFANDQVWGISMFSLRHFWKFMHAFGATSPASPVKNLTRQHKIEKNFNKWIEENKIMIICGHTHRYKYPKKEDLPYFNVGCCIYPGSITGVEIVGENIMMIRWRIVPNDYGVLRIVREVLRGPEPIAMFDLRK